MKKTAIYPGSFNPWHKGHDDILDKALKVFDEVLIVQGINSDKKFTDVKPPNIWRHNMRIRCAKFSGLLADFVKTNSEICAVIRGLRNGQDFEYEKTQQYWNEDLGIGVPTVYFITDREFGHISSSAIRMIEEIKDGKDI